MCGFCGCFVREVSVFGHGSIIILPAGLLYSTCAPPHPLPASRVNADVSLHTEFLLAHSLCPFSLTSLLVLVFPFMLVLSFIFLHLILFPSVIFQVHFHPNTFF